MSYRVRLGRAADAALLGGLESAAAKRFASIGLPQIAGGRPTSEADYLALAAETRLWVTEEDGGELVGLAIADRVDDIVGTPSGVRKFYGQNEYRYLWVASPVTTSTSGMPTYRSLMTFSKTTPRAASLSRKGEVFRE